MTTLRITVPCYRCGQHVAKTEARMFKSIEKQPRYECFSCFKKQKREPWWDGQTVSVKKNFYCEHCQYKFNSKRHICPYCNKTNFLTSRNVSIKELL